MEEDRLGGYAPVACWKQAAGDPVAGEFGFQTTAFRPALFERDLKGRASCADPDGDLCFDMKGRWTAILSLY